MYMTERVYRDKTGKFTLISTTIKDISDLNRQYIGFEGSGDYKMNINFAHRSCVAYGIQGWNSNHISTYALTACNMWDALKLVPANSFLLIDVYEPLNLKLAALRIMVNNFSASDDDNHYWTFVNDELTISDAADNADKNPADGTRRRRNPQNPTGEDDTHHGNPGDPHHGQPGHDPDDLEAMLSQLEHYI